ncbi:two-component system response regulator [Pseudothauera rhizosphaerae]|uniref:EAL domain-containing protein n=1 Tax=Pseudothauera rhizosphaerae TaxID=2565932 RepID=A0A4S4ANS6_9RHOO|nr:EAL domain-containing protein [Pseudothauera rhizosphaerae]THF61307.1 EAL domain-containing protein [Pseudothauera rhizosphaerae]
MKALYVEDNPVDADLFARAFARELPTAELHLARSLAEGTARLAEGLDVDVVLTDLCLPDGSGLELLNWVRERRLPAAVVVLTGSGDQRAAVAALKAGADDYLAKDGDHLHRLSATLDAAIERARAERNRRSRPIRVLYAEHHRFDIDLTIRHLAQVAPHLRLDIVDSAAAVLERLEGESGGGYDVLLVDHMLPGTDALGLTKILREERKFDIPIVMVTGQGSEETAAQALRIGVSDYLVKHHGYLQELPLVLEKACRQADLMRERAALRDAVDKLRLHSAVIDSTHDGVLITDLDGNIVSVNRAFTEITGYPDEESRGRNPRFLQSGRHGRAFYKEMWAALTETGCWQGELWNRRRNGELFPEWLTLNAVHDENGVLTNYVGVFTDISKLRNAEERLSHLAHHDPLTGLPNRLLVLSRLAHAIEVAQRRGHRLAVLCLDLDRFKTVNDSLGHSVGDELLCAVAERLHARLREEDTLGRLGGDEFMVLLDDLDAPQDAAVVANELLGALAEPFALPSGAEMFMHASMGISVYPDDGDDYLALVRNADAAMYRAKAEGRNTYGFYTEDLTRLASQRLELETRLRRALAGGEFVVHYQPVIAVADGRLLGAEALVRWQPPGEVMVPPGAFIPIAEETGLIVALGEWVLGTACRQWREWLDTGLQPGSLAVNLSVEQIRRRDVEGMLREALHDTGLPPRWLELEITESSLMAQGEQAEALLAALKALGIGLAIDDFGTGYSSLAYLKRFSIDKLKIDRSFVQDIADDRNDLAIAAAVVAMARALDISVQAEGVETEAQLDLLRELCCGSYQGYLCSPALPADEFHARFLARR